MSEPPDRPQAPYPAAPLRATVVVCTHNRGSLIAETLESLLLQDRPAAQFEILVVDNASTDATPEVLAGFVGRHPTRIRTVREPALGLSNARNCGILASRGGVIAFTDDDARVSTGWLAALVRACEREEVGCAGGPVRPSLQGNLPPWVTEAFLPYLALFDKGEREVELRYNEYPRGVNIAFPRRIFREIGLFSPEFGRKGKSLLSYEDIELCYRIERLGKKVLYVPGAEVRHVIDAARLSERWFLDRFYWQGKSEAYFDLLHHGPRFVIDRIREHARASKAARAGPAEGSRGEPDLYARCRRRTHVGYGWGAVQGWLTGVARRARPPAYASGRAGAA